jgi:hypothetical protein
MINQGSGKLVTKDREKQEEKREVDSRRIGNVGAKQ